MVNAPINKKILAVWDKHFGAREDVYAPIFYNEFEQGGLLFVGMNPSFNVPVFRGAVRGTEYEKLDPEELYRWSPKAKTDEHVAVCTAISRLVITTYRGYFKRMEEIAEAADLPYQHADLFVYRQTSQKDFLTLIRDKKRNLNEFAKDQLAIFHDIVAAIHPAVIVVPNAFASGILRKEWHESLSFDNDRGFHWLTLNGNRIPIFFSSMLSGQRALDTGSYERLRWHIKQAAGK
jgi:hypothetical protein